MSPFGGFKQSGVGREYGTFGLEGFLETRSVMAGVMGADPVQEPGI
jgi:aldehyde dehydrogenase (NAD+)